MATTNEMMECARASHHVEIHSRTDETEHERRKENARILLLFKTKRLLWVSCNYTVSTISMHLFAEQKGRRSA